MAWIICSDDDFTDLRGTTRVVLRSRHWQTGRTPPEAEESVGAVADNANMVRGLKRDNTQQRERADNAEGALVQLYECLELIFRQMVAGLRNKVS